MIQNSQRAMENCSLSTVNCQLLWGYPRRPREEPRCPVCGRWCQTVYVRLGEALGCEKCVRAVDAWEIDN